MTLWLAQSTWKSPSDIADALVRTIKGVSSLGIAPWVVLVLLVFAVLVYKQGWPWFKSKGNTP